MKSFTNSLIQLIVGDGAPVWRLLVLDLNIGAVRGWSDGTRGVRGGKRVRLLHWNCTEKEYNNEFGQIMTAMQNYMCVYGSSEGAERGSGRGNEVTLYTPCPFPGARIPL